MAQNWGSIKKRVLQNFENELHYSQVVMRFTKIFYWSFYLSFIKVIVATIIGEENCASRAVRGREGIFRLIFAFRNELEFCWAKLGQAGTIQLYFSRNLLS